MVQPKHRISRTGKDVQRGRPDLLMPRGMDASGLAGLVVIHAEIEAAQVVAAVVDHGDYLARSCEATPVRAQIALDAARIVAQTAVGSLGLVPDRSKVYLKLVFRERPVSYASTPRGRRDDDGLIGRE